MIKVHYNENTGEVLGYFDTQLNYAQIPTPTIDITDEQHQNALGKTMIVENGVFKEYVEPNDLKLARAREAKKAQIENEYQASKKACKLTYNNQSYSRNNSFDDMLILCLQWKSSNLETIPSLNLPISLCATIYDGLLLARDTIANNVETAKVEIDNLLIRVDLEDEESEIDYNATIEAINNYEPSNQVVFEEELAIESLMS